MNRILSTVKIFSSVFSMLTLFTLAMSCSLKYDEESKISENTPEFIFTNATFSRYEKDKKILEFQSSAMEQYKTSDSSYAKNAQFQTWDKNGNLTTQGSCFLLAMDSNSDDYTLISDIFIKNLEQNLTIKAQNLKWNGKTQQLISGKEDTVFLTKDDVQLEGKGFSASGISQKYSFIGNVSGTLTTQDQDQQIQSSEGDSTENE